MRGTFSHVLAAALTALLLFGGCCCASHPGGLSASGGPADQEAVGPEPLVSGRFDEILVGDFVDKAPWPDYRVGDETASYFVREMASRFKGRISRSTGPGDPSAPRAEAVVLSGSVTLTKEVRKALRRSAAPADGPFRPSARALDEQAIFTLTLSVTATAGGEILLERSFKEARAYEDIEKPPEFALYELLDRVKADLFPVLFGKPPRRS